MTILKNSNREFEESQALFVGLILSSSATIDHKSTAKN